MAARLPAADPDRPRLRCRGGNAPGACRKALGPVGKPGVAQARGYPAGLQLQAPRGLQQDGPPLARGTGPRGHLRVRGQPCPGRRPQCKTAWMPRRDRHAPDDAQVEVRRRALARGRGGPARRQLLRRLPPRPAVAGTPRIHLRASVRRPGRDRRARDRRHGDPAPAPAPDPRGVRRHRGRRPHLRRRRVHQGGAAGDQGHRGPDGRLGRDGPLRQGGRTHHARRRRPVLRRDGRQAGGRGDVPPDPGAGRRLRRRRHRRGLRRDQGRVRGHAERPRTGRGDGRRRDEADTSRRAG